MAKNFIKPGNTIDYTNGGGSTVTSGSAVLISKRLGVALTDIGVGATGSVMVKGIFNLPKLSTDVIAQGDLVYWDDTNKRLTSTAGGNTLSGYAALAAGNGAPSIDIALNA